MLKLLASVVATGCIFAMTIKEEALKLVCGVDRVHGRGGMLGALAASSCCILPLVLFSWASAAHGSATHVACPYHAYFIAATLCSWDAAIAGLPIRSAPARK